MLELAGDLFDQFGKLTVHRRIAFERNGRLVLPTE
jgi:hypothetical protein